MRKTLRNLVLVILICSLPVLSGSTLATEDQQIPESAAWKALQQGQAVVLMRHALAPGIGDPPEFDVQECATQRNLSDAGRAQAVAMGDTLRANGITDATVLSSQWCRCMETARLLNLGEPEPALMLNSFFQNRNREQTQTQTLNKSLLKWRRDSGEIKILVSHQVNIRSLTGQYTDSGDMLIVTVDNDQPVVLARIRTDPF